MPHPGRLWRIDADGMILNDASSELIKPPFDAALRDVVAAYSAHIPDDLHSIYVTGSVSRGLAVPGESDLDVFAVLEEYLDPELVLQDWIEAAEEQILEAHDSISDVQMELWPYGYVVRDPDEFSVGAFIIKTHSACVWGPDLAPELPDYRADALTLTAIANDDLVQIAADIEDGVAAIQEDPGAANTRYWCRRVCKNIVRAGFGLVMIEAGVHTRDIDLCSEYFARHYPEQAPEMQKAVRLIHRPASGADHILAYLADFGGWITAEADRWLDVHNPARDLELRLSPPDEMDDDGEPDEDDGDGL